MTTQGKLFTLLPTIGILIFVGLSIYATSLYPGGSQVDTASVGFDWANNFWCNLMSEPALNGMTNGARPVAVLASVVLSLSMILFFFHFAKHFVTSIFWKTIIIVTGVVSMLSAVFVFTSHHDLMTNTLSVGGVIGMSAIIRTLHVNKMSFFMWCGIGCIVIVSLNNLFYYVEGWIVYLPIIQKGSFVLILGWTVGLNFKIVEKRTVSSLS